MFINFSMHQPPQVPGQTHAHTKTPHKKFFEKINGFMQEEILKLPLSIAICPLQRVIVPNSCI